MAAKPPPAETSLAGGQLAPQTSTTSVEGSPYGDTDSGRPKDGRLGDNNRTPFNGWTDLTLSEVEQLSRRLLMHRNMHFEAYHVCRNRSDALTYTNIAIAGTQSILAVLAAYTNDVSNGTVSQQLAIVVGVLAAALGILASFQKSLNYGERSVKHRYAMHAFADLNADIEATLIREPLSTRPDGYEYFHWLQRRFSKISSLAPMPPDNVLKRHVKELMDTSEDVPDMQHASFQRRGGDASASVAVPSPLGIFTAASSVLREAVTRDGGQGAGGAALPEMSLGGDHDHSLHGSVRASSQAAPAGPVRRPSTARSLI